MMIMMTAQRQQLHLEHKLCLPPAMAELGFGDHLGTLEVVFVMLILCLYSSSSALLGLVSFSLLCSFSAGYSWFSAAWKLPYAGFCQWL